MSFHSKMIKLRKIKGLTQESFASQIGVSRQSVYKWESGQSYPDVEKLLKIARTFGVTVDDMLNDEMDVDRQGVMRPVEEVKAEEERIAREKYFMKKPNEDVFVFEEIENSGILYDISNFLASKNWNNFCAHCLCQIMMQFSTYAAVCASHTNTKHFWTVCNMERT